MEGGVNGFDIDYFAGVFLLHVAGDGEVAVVLQDVVDADQPGEVLHFLTLLEHVENAVLVFVGQAVLVAVLLELLRGIDEEHTVVGARTLAQHNDADGYAHTKEEIRGQLDDGVHIVVLDEPVADGALLASTIKHTGKLHDGSRATLG